MRIDTQFEVGQTVWTPNGKHWEPRQHEIESIRVEVDAEDGLWIGYFMKYHGMARSGCDLYATEAECQVECDRLNQEAKQDGPTL